MQSKLKQQAREDLSFFDQILWNQIWSFRLQSYKSQEVLRTNEEESLSLTDCQMDMDQLCKFWLLNEKMQEYKA